MLIITNNENISNFLYLRQSQCIFAVRIPGNMNMAPVTAHHMARQNLTINFDAGPLKYVRSIHKIINSLNKMLDSNY